MTSKRSRRARSLDTSPIEARPDALSFITRNLTGGAGYDYWAVESTGDYAADCEIGRKLGEEYLAFVGRFPTNGNRMLLSSIVDSMMAKRSTPSTHWGRHTTGLEIGFFGAVSEFAMAAAAIVTKSAAEPA